jgi:hypothetical protein
MGGGVLQREVTLRSWHNARRSDVGMRERQAGIFSCGEPHQRPRCGTIVYSAGGHYAPASLSIPPYSAAAITNPASSDWLKWRL